jgi:uncharacterized protein (DUF2384 family)
MCTRMAVGRRKRTVGSRRIESEQAVRLGGLIALGIVALGSPRAMREWLVRPNTALGGVVPLTMLRTNDATHEIEAVLGRALLGGYS